MGWLGWPNAAAMSWAGWLFATAILIVRGRHRARDIALFAVFLAVRRLRRPARDGGPVRPGPGGVPRGVPGAAGPTRPRPRPASCGPVARPGHRRGGRRGAVGSPRPARAPAGVDLGGAGRELLRRACLPTICATSSSRGSTGCPWPATGGSGTPSIPRPPPTSASSPCVWAFWPWHPAAPTRGTRPGRHRARHGGDLLRRPRRVCHQPGHGAAQRGLAPRRPTHGVGPGRTGRRGHGRPRPVAHREPARARGWAGYSAPRWRSWRVLWSVGRGRLPSVEAAIRARSFIWPAIGAVVGVAMAGVLVGVVADGPGPDTRPGRVRPRQDAGRALSCSPCRDGLPGRGRSPAGVVEPPVPDTHAGGDALCARRWGRHWWPSARAIATSPPRWGSTRTSTSSTASASSPTGTP